MRHYAGTEIPQVDGATDAKGTVKTKSAFAGGGIAPFAGGGIAAAAALAAAARRQKGEQSADEARDDAKTIYPFAGGGIAAADSDSHDN